MLYFYQVFPCLLLAYLLELLRQLVALAKEVIIKFTIKIIYKVAKNKSIDVNNIKKHQKYCINIKRNLKGLLRKTKANL